MLPIALFWANVFCIVFPIAWLAVVWKHAADSGQMLGYRMWLEATGGEHGFLKVDYFLKRRKCGPRPTMMILHPAPRRR